MSPQITCPRCNGPTVKKPYEAVEIDSCLKCSGIWLDKGELEKVISVKQEKFAPEFVTKTLSQAVAGIPKSESSNSIECPVCQSSTRCINYNYGSGVIINICADHGIWFDSGELQRIEVFMEHWNAKKEAQGAEWLNQSASAAAVQNSKIKEIDQEVSSMSQVFKLMSFLGKD